MLGRRVRCSSCGVQLTVPPNAQNIWCVQCNTAILVQQNDLLSLSHNSKNKVTNPNAQNIRCMQCNTDMQLVQQNDPLSLSHNHKNKVRTKIKDFIGTISSNINMIVATAKSNSKQMTSGHSPYPQPVRSMPSVATISTKGRKRAVLCGVSYLGQVHRLKGTVNDVRFMKSFLIERMDFPKDSIVLLSEEEADPSLIPTKQNIRKALHWLVQGCKSGDSLVFHFSGHGSQQRAMDWNEIDGYDELLWPVDHETEGKILDNEINATIVRPLINGVKLHAIIDACHSGTVLDLPFVCRMNREGYYYWEDHGYISTTGAKGGWAISFGACDDHQISLDTTALSGDKVTGAMTYSFIQTILNEQGLTYGRLLYAMRHKIHNATANIQLTGPISQTVGRMKHTQEPQLSSTETFDIYSEPFGF